MKTIQTAKSAGMAFALCLSLGACVSFGGKAPPSLLTLTASNSVAKGTVKSGASADALIVLLPEAPRKLDNNRVPVQIDDSSLAYLKDAVWADKPARLMQLLLMETIAAKSGRLVLNETDAGGKATQYLSGSLLEFGIDASASEAVVVYDAVKMVRGLSVDKKRFEVRRPVSAVEPGPSGSALNEAANDVASQVSDWLG
ncbi:MAG TPA: ABC-type transport auxiliary lipoprotein family protein [Sphingorhabdus sp.]|jgi:cholesterol transport system auxiliary component|nr:ABC-type transport auxiliary lipoprotein family protein [Sphingorhabdus sp.]